MHFPMKPGEVCLYMQMASKPSFIIYHVIQTPLISNRVIHSISQNSVSPLCPLLCYCFYSLFPSCMKLCLYLSPRPGSRFISLKNISINCVIPNEMFSSFYILLVNITLKTNYQGTTIWWFRNDISAQKSLC